MASDKWNGERARDGIAKRIVEESKKRGRPVTSDEAHRKSIEIVRRRERTQQGN